MEKKKIQFQLDTPYSEVSWPQVSQAHQETILELLCTLLSPIGAHRTEYIQGSKGKRAKKRKRKTASIEESSSTVPPVPDIVSSVDVGLSTISRHLQTIVQQESSLHGADTSATSIPNEAVSQKPYAALFVARSGHPSILQSHLPQMIACASGCCPSEPPTRLVGFSKACQDQLSVALGIPRASCIGIREDAPNSQALIDFVRQHVPVIKVPWLEEARVAEFRETKINSIETVIGSKRQKK